MPKTMRLGIFIVGTLLAFGVGVFLIGNGQFRFSSKYRLYADFQNVAGLDDGAAVRVGGIHEGTVHAILLPSRPDRKVRVEMDLKGATRSVIKKDSVAAIRTEGLVGDQFVEISFGTPGAPDVRNGDTIGTEPPLQISDVIKKTNAILDSVQQTAENLEGISQKVNSGKGSIGALLNNRTVFQHVNEAAANLQEDTEALKHNFLLRGFFKNRGYEDTEEIKRNAIASLPAGEPEKAFNYRAAKLFDKPENAKLNGGKQLDPAGKYLEAGSHGLAVVAAYTDLKGDTDKDRQLTQARAAVVREYLVQHYKLDDSRIKTFGAGKSGDAPDGGAVQILVYPPVKTK